MSHKFDIPPLVEVHLMGEMGRLFPEPVRVRGWTVADLMRGVLGNLPGLKRVVYAFEDAGVKYRILKDDRPMMSEEEVYSPPCCETVHLYPVPMGAGGIFSSGVGQLIAGVVIFGIGIATGGLGLVALAGLSLALGGAAKLFSSPQSSPANEVEQAESFLFDFNARGAGRQLGAIPMPFGERMMKLDVGASAVSQLIESHDLIP